MVIALMGAQLFAGGDTKIKFEWGPEYKIPKKHGDLGFVGNSEVGYTQITHKYGADLTLQHFDTRLNLGSTNTLNLKSMPKGYMSEAFVEAAGGKNYWLFTTWDKKTQTERLFSYEMDVKKGAFIGEAKELISVVGKLSGNLVMTGYMKFNTGDKYQVVLSSDKKRILVYYRRKPEEKRDKLNKDKIGYYVYDENMKELWHSETEMPYTEAMMDNVDYQVDASGTIYLLARVYNSEPEKHKERVYHLSLLKWAKDDKKAVEIKVPVDKNFLRETVLTEDKNGKLIIAGYYSKDMKRSGVDGAFVLKLDEGSNTISNLKKGYYEFPASVLAEFESSRSKRKMDKKDAKGDLQADNLLLRKVVVNDDGSIEMYGEQYYYTMYVVMTNSGPRTNYSYFFDDVIALRIREDGELAWVKKIPKAQMGNNTTIGLGIKQFSYAGNSYVFFLDNEKNTNITPDKAPARHMAGHGGFLMAVKIGPDGTMSKSQVFDIRKEKFQVQPTNFDKVGDNQMIVRCTKGLFGGGPSKAALITF